MRLEGVKHIHPQRFTITSPIRHDSAARKDED